MDHTNNPQKYDAASSQNMEHLGDTGQSSETVNNQKQKPVNLQNPSQNTLELNDGVQDVLELSSTVQNQLELNNSSQHVLQLNTPTQPALGISDPSQNPLELRNPAEKQDRDLVEQSSLNPITLTILQGVYDDNSPLSNLRSIPHVLQIIMEYVKSYWKCHIQIGKNELGNNAPNNGQFAVQLAGSSLSYRLRYGKLTFPKPSDININMMPFIMAPTFSETFLPDYLKQYFDRLIIAGILGNGKNNCIMGDEMGKICYISVQESWVEANTSQRREGLHIESPGKLTIKPEVMEDSEENQGMAEMGESDRFNKNKEGRCTIPWYVVKGEGSSVNFKGIHQWGRSSGHLQGGIYMASTVSDSCKVWDCQVIPDQGEEGDIVGQLGNIEHLRNYLGEGHIMEEDQMYWITDRTPHESLRLPVGTYRQWFRLVTSGVSLWFQDHSTKNPLGILPDSKLTKIVKGSKFDEKNLEVVCPKYGFKQYKVKIKKKMQKQIKKFKN